MIQKVFFSLLPITLVAFVIINDAPANEQFEGTIVETMEYELTLHDLHTGEYQTFTVEGDTQITLNGQHAELSDLLPFYQATVIAEFDGHGWFAQSIEANTANQTVKGTGSSPSDSRMASTLPRLPILMMR